MLLLLPFCFFVLLRFVYIVVVVVVFLYKNNVEATSLYNLCSGDVEYCTVTVKEENFTKQNKVPFHFHFMRLSLPLNRK